MKLRKLQLENFRNYEKYTYDFPIDKDLIVLTGENGKGKTNFLEAIYSLSLGRSFRTLHKDDLILWGKDYFKCSCTVEADDEESQLEVFYSIAPKVKRNFRINEVNMRNSQYIGNLITVLFHPEDLNMLYLSPSYRRKYLNTVLSQTSRKYLEDLSSYNKVVKQRNSLLHTIRDAIFKGEPDKNLYSDLDVWDEQIAHLGLAITKSRIELIKFIEKKSNETYHEISGGSEKITIKHKSKVDEKTTHEGYVVMLQEKRKRDVFEAKTSLGPHLDDLVFFIDDKEINGSASRGEFRTLLLSIKLAEINYIQEKTGKNPILLLDDVFSELDKGRQSHLLEVIKSCQTIITTTDTENLGGSIPAGKCHVTEIE